MVIDEDIGQTVTEAGPSTPVEIVGLSGVPEAGDEFVALSAIKQIALRNGDKWVLKAAIRPVVKRLDPTFDEASYGCRSFADLLKKHNDKFQIERGQHDHLVGLIE